MLVLEYVIITAYRISCGDIHVFPHSKAARSRRSLVDSVLAY